MLATCALVAPDALHSLLVFFDIFRPPEGPAAGDSLQTSLVPLPHFLPSSYLPATFSFTKKPVRPVDMTRAELHLL